MEKKRNAIFDRILNNIPKEDKIVVKGDNFTMKTISKIEAVLDEPIITVSQKQQPQTMPLIIIGNFSQNLSFTPQDTNRGTNEYATNCTYMSRHTFDN